MGGDTKPSEQLRLQGALHCLQLARGSSSACGEGRSPTRVTSDPLPLHIKASSCPPGSASPLRQQEPLQQRILGRALVPWGDREGVLGSQNSQETKYREQQQQQERQGAGRMLSSPPRGATFAGAPDRMGRLRLCEGLEVEVWGLPASSAAPSPPFPFGFYSLGSPKAAIAFPRSPSSFPNPNLQLFPINSLQLRL